MLWGYAKYHELYLTGYQLIIHYSMVIGQLLAEDFKKAFSQCLDMCDTMTIQWFFHKTWRYMDAYYSLSYQLRLLMNISCDSKGSTAGSVGTEPFKFEYALDINAQSTASTALANSASTLSPAELTKRP